MSFFKKFRANFNLRNPKKRKIDKSEAVGVVQCLKYKIISEFAEEQVFNKNPRHFPEQHFTPTTHRKEHPRPLSENDLYWQRLAKQKPQEEKRSDVEPKNIIWPTESEINSEQNPTETTPIEKTKIREAKTADIDEKFSEDKSQIDAKLPIIKSILKNVNNGETKRDHVENSRGKVNFGFQNVDERSYERFEQIDDHLEDNVYFPDQVEEDEKELYVVHKASHEKTNSIGKKEKERPFKRVEDDLNMEPVQAPTYNTLSHPKLNPTASNDQEEGRGFNTFGNAQKLRTKVGYSNQAASIFFDSDHEEESEDNEVRFEDVGSEMSA